MKKSSIIYISVIILIISSYWWWKPFYLSVFIPASLEKISTPIIMDLNTDPVFSQDIKKDAFDVNDNKWKSVKLTPIWQYEITWKIKYFIEYPGFLDSCPYQNLPSVSMVLAWWKISEDKYYKWLTVKDNWSAIRFELTDWNLSWDPWLDYITYHTSINDLIPSNKNIKNAIKHFKKDETIKIKGYLVDIYYPSANDKFRTSNWPADLGTTLPWNAWAKEIIYVTEILTKDGIYK